MNKYSKKIFIVFGLVYFVQGIQGLSTLPIFFWLKDDIGLTVTQMTSYGALIGVAWLIKPIWAFITDSVAIKGSHRKSYIVLAYVSIIAICVYISMNGLTLSSYLVLMSIVSLALAFSDVACDGLMVEVGQKFDICDKLQSVQWACVSIASVLTGVTGGYIARYLGVRFSTGVIGGIMILVLVYITLIDKTPERKAKKILNTGKCLNGIKEGVKNKKLWISVAFLFCLWASPSFGTSKLLHDRYFTYI